MPAAIHRDRGERLTLVRHIAVGVVEAKSRQSANSQVVLTGPTNAVKRLP